MHSGLQWQYTLPTFDSGTAPFDGVNGGELGTVCRHLHVCVQTVTHQ